MIIANLWLFDGQFCRPEVTSGTLLFSSDDVYSPFQKRPKVSLWIVLVIRPILFDKGFQLGKKFQMGFRSGEYGGRYTSLTPALSHMWSIRSL
jgi:hypothetical protein